MKETNTAIFNTTDPKPCHINNSQKSLNCTACRAEILLGTKSLNVHFYYLSFIGKTQSVFICIKIIIKTGTRALQQGDIPEKRNSFTIYRLLCSVGLLFLVKNWETFTRMQ